jgi:hypothetical protein
MRKMTDIKEIKRRDMMDIDAEDPRQIGLSKDEIKEKQQRDLYSDFANTPRSSALQNYNRYA